MMTFRRLFDVTLLVNLLVLMAFISMTSGTVLGTSKNNLNTFRRVKELGRSISRQVNVLEDPSDISIFYSVKDNHVIKEMMPRPWITPGQSLRLPFVGDPCSCFGTTCGCCVGINITAFKFDKTLCANVSLDTSALGIFLDVYINNETVLHNGISAANPPAICIPLVISGVPTGIDFCLRLYNISLLGYNVHVCIDLEVRIVTAPVLLLHFDCVNLGFDGVSLSKPNSTSTYKPGDETATIPTTESVDGDIFDPVTEGDSTTEAEDIEDVNKKNGTLIITGFNETFAIQINSVLPKPTVNDGDPQLIISTPVLNVSGENSLEPETTVNSPTNSPDVLRTNDTATTTVKDKNTDSNGNSTQNLALMISHENETNTNLKSDNIIIDANPPMKITETTEKVEKESTQPYSSSEESINGMVSFEFTKIKNNSTEGEKFSNDTNDPNYVISVDAPDVNNSVLNHIVDSNYNSTQIQADS